MARKSLFDSGKEFILDKKLRLIELFAGYGSQSLSLKYLGIPFEHWKICEWAIPSIQAYKDTHFTNDTTDYSYNLTKEDLVDFFAGKISSDYNIPLTKEQLQRFKENKLRVIYNNAMASHNLLSICTTHAEDLEIVDTKEYDYLVTYSFPCQSLSVSGKQHGMAKGSGTRSGMLWEFERILKELDQLGGKDKLPQILLMENVPPILSEKFFGDFQMWISFLYSLGYKSYYKILNSKEFGIPQNRERCFMVSLLGDYQYQFPEKYGLDIRLKHILEKNVDESYYLTKVDINRIANWNAYQKPLESIKDIDSISPTITTRSGADCAGMILVDDPVICASRGRNPENPSDRTSGSPTEQRFEIGGDISNTLTTVQKDNYVLEPAETICLNSKVDGTQPSLSNRVYDTNGISTTIATSPFFTGSILEPEDNRNLKERLCDELVESGLVKEYDTINHSYTNGLCGKNKNSRQTLEDFIETTNNTVGTLTTRPDVLGVVVKDESLNQIDGIPIAQATRAGYEICKEYGAFNMQYPNSKTRRGRVIENGNICPTLQANNAEIGVVYPEKEQKPALRIRKLTERECSRLMGVVEEDFSNMALNQSKSSLYHLSGDSIVTTCLMAILGKLFGVDYRSKIESVVNKICEKNV